MRTRKLKLGKPDLGAQIEQRYRQEKDMRRKVRLLCVKLAVKGEHAANEIAEVCGCSRASVFEWIKSFRQGGFESLLAREKPGPKAGELRGISSQVSEQLREGVQEGRWATAEAARQWLEREHGVRRPYVTVWQWLKKFGGVLRVPRPRHPGANPLAAEAFKKELGVRLDALGLAAVSRVRAWVMDEARFGLHTETRKVWITKGVRPAVHRQTRYEWDYLYGALEVVEGHAAFLHLPTVDLDCNRLERREVWMWEREEGFDCETGGRNPIDLRGGEERARGGDPKANDDAAAREPARHRPECAPAAAGLATEGRRPFSQRRNAAGPWSR